MMTSQEEQFLQAAEKGNKEYVQVNLNNISLEVKTVAFVLTPFVEISQVLLSHGVDINARATDEIRGEYYVSNWTALGYACETNNLLKVKWLVAKGADLHKTSHLIGPDRFTNWEMDCTPQKIALRKGNLTLAELVCIDNTHHSTKQDLFFDAVKNGFEEEVKNYLQQGINVNIMNDNGQTPLMIAVKNKKDTIVDILLTAKADVSMKDKDKFSALLYASAVGNSQSVGSLLQAGANPNDTLPNNQTALMLAARSGNGEAVHLLMEAGADVTRCADNGYSVPLYAVIGGSTTALQELLAHGAAKTKTPQGTTALMLAVREENFNMVKLLLEMGADVNAQDNNGQTALKIANVHNKPEIIDLLKSAGAKE